MIPKNNEICIIKNKKYEIQFDMYIRLWVVWLAEKNYLVMCFKSETKKECKKWLNSKKNNEV